MTKVYPRQREELKEDDADASTDSIRGEQQPSSCIRSSSTSGAVARKNSNRNMLLVEEQDPEQEQRKASTQSGHRKADCASPGRREEGPCFKDQARSFAAQVPGAVPNKNNGRTTVAERDPEESKEELDHERVAASSRLEEGPSFKDQVRSFAAQVPGAVRHGNNRGNASPSRSQLPSPATEGPDFKDQVRDQATSARSTTPGASSQITVPSVKDRMQSQPSPGASSVAKALPTYKDQVREQPADNSQYSIGGISTIPGLSSSLDQVPEAHRPSTNSVESIKPSAYQSEQGDEENGQLPGAEQMVPADRVQFDDDDDWSGIKDTAHLDLTKDTGKGTFLVEAQVVDEREVYLAESVEDGVFLNRRRLCIVVVVMLGIVAAIVGGVCGSGNCSSSDDGAKPVTITQPQCTATAPKVDFDTTSERYLALRGLFSFVFGPESFEDESEDNPRFWALHWLANVDEMELAIDSSQVDRLAQRYVMVLLYYSTAGWCWSNQINWLSAQSECRWDTTSCVDESTTIREIRMISNNLNGPLPSELGVLTNLTLLDFGTSLRQKTMEKRNYP